MDEAEKRVIQVDGPVEEVAYIEGWPVSTGKMTLALPSIYTFSHAETVVIGGKEYPVRPGETVEVKTTVRGI